MKQNHTSPLFWILTLSPALIGLALLRANFSRPEVNRNPFILDYVIFTSSFTLCCRKGCESVSRSELNEYLRNDPRIAFKQREVVTQVENEMAPGFIALLTPAKDQITEFSRSTRS